VRKPLAHLLVLEPTTHATDACPHALGAFSPSLADNTSPTNSATHANGMRLAPQLTVSAPSSASR
jgi:hypothetical protein